MKVNILASGSSGNCIALTVDEKTILIDAGIAKTKIEKALLEVDIKATDVKAIFVTHAHGDHIKGLPIANKYKIPVYATAGEFKTIKGVDEDLKRVVIPKETIKGAGYYVESFNTHHDSHDPVGYVVTGPDGHKCSICLDTGHVDEEMITAMEFSNTYIIEANHEPKMVEASGYPNSVKSRIVSNIGHLSNQQVADALKKMVQGVQEDIYLVHLSSSNNMPALAEMTVIKALTENGLKVGADYKIEVI